MPRTTMNNTTATTTTNRIATPINALGLKEFDLVKTVGKGIGIVLRKPSLNDELVIYSISSATETHRNDDDGMAKVRRYNADGTIASTSETSGRNLRNRDQYTIVGIASYVNPVLAMKDFINQNANIDFDPVIVESDNELDDDVVSTPDPTADVTVAPDIMSAFAEMAALLREMNDKLDNI